MFIAGRDPQKLIAQDLTSAVFSPDQRRATKFDVDRKTGCVTLTAPGVGGRVAIFTAKMQRERCCCQSGKHPCVSSRIASHVVCPLGTALRLVTGDPDDPNSTDVQLSNFDDDLQFALDQAYVQVSLRDLKLYGGKVPQPFTRTDLARDSDVNPKGVSAVYKRSLGNGSALRVNGLYFLVDEDVVAADSRMAGAQLGYDFTASDKLKFDLSLAYYDYTLGSVVGADAGDFRTSLPIRTAAINPTSISAMRSSVRRGRVSAIAGRCEPSPTMCTTSARSTLRTRATVWTSQRGGRARREIGA